VKIDPNDPRPPFRQFADDMRRRIRAGEYLPGELLPSIRQLASEYGISTQTTQNGLRELRSEGLVVSQQGRGFYVRDPARPAAGPDTDIAGRLAAVETELRALRDQHAKAEAELREQIASLRIQVMNLHARDGSAQPPGQASPER
jgi:DNA-binding transcriptional regulator YhcF (GntR family)